MASATSTPAAAPSGRSSRSASRRSAAGGLPAPGTGTSPTRMYRIQEKDELRRLNDRLANYIQRVQELESERSSILFQLEEKDDSKSREMCNVRRLYEEELADVRKSLDVLAGERARLQIDYGNLCEEYRKLQARNQKKESDLANALAQWRKVEATLSCKDAEFTKLLSENRRLHDDLAEQSGQLENVEGTLAATKNQLSTEILRRVDLENQVQTLKEQLGLQKNISDQEILEIRSRHESRLVELDSGRRREFDSKLADTMQQLRKDHESQVQQYKEEIDRTFSSKLQNAQEAALEKNSVASATRDELETTKLRVESLSSQLQQYQKDKMVLESRFQELERTLDGERELWQQRLSQKEQEMLTMRSQMFAQLEDYENLLDVKLALDMEINAYRKMLEVEEQRLQLSPSPSQHTAIPRTHEHGSRKLRGKKRKYEGASGHSPAYKMSSRLTEHGTVSVAEVDMDGKYVRLKNNSEAEQPLGGWVVRRMYPDSGDLSFHIPSSCILAGGQTLTIWAAGSEADADSGDLVLQGHRSWGPVTDVRVVLLDPNHEEMAEHRVCMQQRGEEETELEFDDEYVAGSDIQHFRRQDLSKEGSCSVM
ncbi:lamin L3 isoform X2 [Anoplopoma fimbria]|uniref:lamin L3 isoform X2 n=1 Tax=Anoplopoma fimbria TaxID=229290 RepID=UPI0023EE0642|nr:lamin L3 isoform X2 [Anoplopoma fimbria]